MKSKLIIEVIFFLLIFAVSSFYFLTQPNKSGYKFNSLVQKIESIDSRLGSDSQSIVFVSKFQNLGIIQIKFNQTQLEVTPSVNFRIKENNTDGWLYENQYLSSQLGQKPFPFGFPSIGNSDKQKYVIEIHPLTRDSIRSIQAIYIYPISTLKNIITLRYFAIHKIGNLFQNNDDLQHIIFSFLPVLIYILIKTLKQKALHHQILFSGLVFLDILFYPISDYSLIALSVYWIYTTTVFGFKNIHSLSISGFFFLISLIFSIYSLPPIGEKAAIWSIVILSITIFSSILHYPKRKSVTRNIS